MPEAVRRLSSSPQAVETSCKYIAFSRLTTAELQTGTNLVLQPTSGNVGIGTTSPISILDVRTGTGHRVSMRDASLIGGLSTAGMIEAYNDAGSATIPLEIESSTLLLNSISGGTVGIGTVTPDSPLTVSSNTSGLQPPGGGANGTILHIAGVDGTNSRVLLDSYGTSAAAYLSIRAARGTAASPSALQKAAISLAASVPVGMKRALTAEPQALYFSLPRKTGPTLRMEMP